MANERNTIQKHLILSALASLNHPTAEQVYAFVAEQNPHISKGTVYRNLNQLAEGGRLLRLQLPSGPDIYDLTLSPHYHVRCSGCGRVDDVEMPYLHDLLAQIKGSSGFLIESYQLCFEGVCTPCQTKNDGGRTNE